MFSVAIWRPSKATAIAPIYCFKSALVVRQRGCDMA